MSTTAETQEAETSTDGPLLDLTDAGVKRFIKQAKARGYVTMDELNKVLPSEEVTSEQIEDTLAMLSEMGVNVVENEETEGEGEGGQEVAQREESSITVAEKPESYDRTDDPVRMYLREMGSVELLSREGEIAIAKRIEAGRDTMIRGLCESALTFEAIMVWREELGSGRILLREVIDLEQTYGGSLPQAAPPGEGGEVEEVVPEVAAEEAPAGEKPEGAEGQGDDDDDFDDGAGPSVSAMEAELREGVMATLDAIAAEFEAFRKLQERLVEARLTGKDLSDVVLVTCQDGYQVAFSLGEIDPGTAKGQVLIADRADGAPLDAHSGPFQVVVEDDARPARDARMVARIELIRLAPPAK